MKINLDYVLKRNKTDLITFVRLNKLKSYSELLSYCATRDFIPCTEKEYNEVSGPKNVKQIKKTSSAATSKKAVTTSKKTVARKTSQAPAKKRRRYSRKKQQES